MRQREPDVTDPPVSNAGPLVQVLQDLALQVQQP